MLVAARGCPIPLATVRQPGLLTAGAQCVYHPTMKCIRINVSMPDKTRQRLAVLAGDDHISMSEVIRRLVDAAWRDRRAPEPEPTREVTHERSV